MEEELRGNPDCECEDADCGGEPGLAGGAEGVGRPETGEEGGAGEGLEGENEVHVGESAGLDACLVQGLGEAEKKDED